MQKLITILLILVLITFSQMQSKAQGISLGVFSSITGHGISCSLDYELKGEMDTFSLLSDTYGLLSARSEDVGIRFNYTHSFIYAMLEGEDFLARFHGGVGICTGFVHEFENGLFLRDKLPLTKNMGVIAAVNCSIGVRIDFHRPIAIELSCSAAPGIHIRRDHSGMLNISFYKRGIYHALLPQISLYYLL